MTIIGRMFVRVTRRKRSWITGSTNLRIYEPTTLSLKSVCSYRKKVLYSNYCVHSQEELHNLIMRQFHKDEFSIIDIKQNTQVKSIVILVGNVIKIQRRLIVIFESSEQLPLIQYRHL